ncbi:LacI family DNA-binding transcriptional regulator [Lacisediminihabitans profunda]|uniref:LacI family transcriptional regulator n=1 Tax=Lacisediminihabitans profunda TaxID=2594790 RepID=A0A5C8UXU3_9MICO|nr:LacI family DNA-binding transcriptional regulator [Lacisediminihabitans profunda]TXN32461.1 LacI family transcriptional regulator [Lacisediminihabitans profunda]
MSITMHDVARVAGVSIKTVSNVINDYPYIRAETRQRVLDAIDSLGYRPNLSARGLRSGRTGVISLIIPDLRNAYFAELADSVMRAAATKNLSVIIEQSGDDRETELALLRGPRMQMVDGILYSVLALGEDDAHLLDDIRTPMVLLGERIFHGPTDHVTMRNTEGARAATEHLLSLGRRRIVALGAHRGEVIGSAGLRLTGYAEALAEAGIPVDDALIGEVGGWFRSGGAQAMKLLLDSGVPFDGVVAFNDSIALGAMRILQEAGLRIPDDVAVIGFDDIDETRYTLPTLSTINPGRDEIARVAVDYLVERISNPEAEIPPREYLAGFTVVQRESTTIVAP